MSFSDKIKQVLSTHEMLGSSLNTNKSIQIPNRLSQLESEHDKMEARGQNRNTKAKT